MLRIKAGGTTRYCDGIDRRSFVQLGMAGMASFGLPQILQARQANAAKKDTAVILFWLDGGPSQLDTYDMKPDAPSEYRFVWRHIPTNVPGIDITQMFPRQAKIADKFAIVRSIHHDTGDHWTGAHIMLTGRGGPTGLNPEPQCPSVGAIASKLCGPRRAGVPPYVAIPQAYTVGVRPGYWSGSYLGHQFDPFETDGDPNAQKFQVNNLHAPPGLTIDRLEDRHALLRQFDRMRRDVDASHAMESMDVFERQAYEMVVGPAARKAFDLESEAPKTRDLYGRNSLGQSALLARRLVEAGTTFVTLFSAGWDHHWDMQVGLERLFPQVDMAVAGLLEDLSDRGMLEKTLVIVCGEFGRTPRMNDGGNGGPPLSQGTPGRDHWGNSMSVLLAGGGVRGGQVYGSTNHLGEVPQDKPLHPCDLLATIYHVLGVDPNTSFVHTSGRPVPALDQGRVIEGLF